MIPTLNPFTGRLAYVPSQLWTGTSPPSNPTPGVLWIDPQQTLRVWNGSTWVLPPVTIAHDTSGELYRLVATTDPESQEVVLGLVKL